ncbi:nitrilase-related carbon-nitrogen hydrolase [Paenibacillus donghaensis]|uniref:nitrilase-related carbon-nitrogen hydrolase n=1 Tax=Paenibacillus donghaensis TaxID=414771 RepID=UPI001B80E788|nr:nitrilase-related carbon-nitrogen hydrolase [Paenibacillus donghaensis]
MMDYPKYKAAAVQAAPVWLDLEASTEKACRLIEEAAGNGAKIIAFPEAFLPGYPWWILHGDPIMYGMKYWERFYKNSVEIPGSTVSKLSAAAKNNDIYVSISVTEKDGGSLYLTQLWFDNKGNLMGKHRKVKPTIGERTIWGEGDSSMMPVFATAELGRVGGLQCWEAYHRLSAKAMPVLSVLMVSLSQSRYQENWKESLMPKLI